MESTLCVNEVLHSQHGGVRTLTPVRGPEGSRQSLYNNNMWDTCSYDTWPLLAKSEGPGAPGLHCIKILVIKHSPQSDPAKSKGSGALGLPPGSYTYVAVTSNGQVLQTFQL